MNVSLTAIAALLVGATAICQTQVPLPAHSSVYTGYSRGYSFTAQNNFVLNHLELPLDAQLLATDTASFYLEINGVQVHREAGSVGPQSQTINAVVAPGDVVVIVGNWSGPTPAQFTAQNSYGSGGGTYSVAIEGANTTLYRAGTQWDIADTVGYPTPLSFSLINGSMGRIWMYTSPAVGYATKSNYGTGCGAVFTDSFYEMFSSTSAHDLTGSIQMLNGGSSYVVLPGTAALRGTANATSLGLGDDNDVDVPFALGTLSMPLADGTTTNQLTVCSNGFVSAQPGNQTGFSPSAAEILSEPQMAWYHWTDLRPVGGGGAGDIFLEETATHVYVIYDAVQTWGGTTVNTFEFHFEKATGHVEFVLGSVDTTNNWGVGFSGAGASLIDPGNSDLSDPLTYPLTVNGAQGGAITLDGDVTPAIGSTVNMTISGLPASTALAAVVYGLTKHDPGIDLTSFGMAGCFQYCSQDAVVLLFPAGAPTASNGFVVPNDPSLAGLNVRAQGGAYDPGNNHNTIRAITTNGVELGVDLL